MRAHRFLGLAALLACGACSTEEIGPGRRMIVQGVPGPEQGAMLIALAPTSETRDEQISRQAAISYAEYHIFVDGIQVAEESLYPVTLFEGSTAGLGYLPAGPHHFEIRPADSGTPAFAADTEIAPDSMTRLYLFGPQDDLQGRFLSSPSLPPPGMVHVSLINLIRGGARIEVVSCPDPSACVAVSPPLALGESFDGDFPEGDSQNPDRGWYVDSTSAGIGCRLIPTTALPAPPVQPMLRSFSYVYNGYGAPLNPASFERAPAYVSAAGVFN
jgi:hypothetical protein